MDNPFMWPMTLSLMSLRQLGLILALKYWDSLSWLLSSQQKMLFYITGPLLKGLSEYKIQKKISFDHFNRFLQNCGSNLVCLRLSCCQYVDNDVIKHLGQYCPNLEGHHLAQYQGIKNTPPFLLIAHLFVYTPLFETFADFCLEKISEDWVCSVENNCFVCLRLFVLWPSNLIN